MIRPVRGLKITATLLFLVLSTQCLGGCAGQGKKMPTARLQAIAHNQRGVEEEARGRREEALTEFSEAFRLHGSIENRDGMIIALINIARTQRLGGDCLAARDSIDRALSLILDSSELASEFYFEKSKILLSSGNLAEAKELAVRAEALEKGEVLGMRSNLVAIIQFRMGLLDEALKQTEKALKINRESGLAGEEANSLVTVNRAHLSSPQAFWHIDLLARKKHGEDY